jgi:hypothetical protein
MGGEPVLELLLALGLLWIVLALLVGIAVDRAAALRERRDRPGAEIVPLRRRPRAPTGGNAA